MVGDPFEADSLAGRSFISIPLIGDMAGTELPQRDPLPLGAEPPDGHEPGTPDKHPQVLGVYCKNGHFDDPEARYCAVCGIGMAQLTKTPQQGKRPPLGVLVLEDGSVFQLDTDYVLGREPTLDSSVADGSARPLRLGTASGPGVPDPRPRRARRLAGLHLRPDFRQRHRVLQPGEQQPGKR